MSLLKIGEITIKPTKLNNTGKPYYSFSGSLDTNIYTDITSNNNWMEIGVKKYDYLFCRNQVMIRTAVIGFSALTTEEQKVAARHFAVGPEDRASVYTDKELEDYWGDFMSKAKNARELRWSAVKDYVSYNLTIPDSIDLAKSTQNFSNEYVVYGIESFVEDGVDALYDWLENTSSFSGGTGFSGKTYWSMSAQTKIMDIFRNGNY